MMQTQRGALLVPAAGGDGTAGQLPGGRGRCRQQGRPSGRSDVAERVGSLLGDREGPRSPASGSWSRASRRSARGDRVNPKPFDRRAAKPAGTRGRANARRQEVAGHGEILHQPPHRGHGDLHPHGHRRAGRDARACPSPSSPTSSRRKSRSRPPTPAPTP